MHSICVQSTAQPFTPLQINKPFISLLVTFLLSLTLFFNTSPVSAGTLDSFKKNVKKGSDASREINKNTSRSRSSKNDDLFDFFIFDLLFKAVEYTALSSHSRVNLFEKVNTLTSYTGYDNESNFNFRPRQIGDPDLPFLQLEGQFHNIWGDTSALNYKATVGYGMLAYKYEQHFYRESSPKSDLNITKQQWLLRLSLGENIEFHQGLGTSVLTDKQGFRHEEMLYTSPIKIKFSEQYLIEFAPTWTSSYDEYDISISKYQPYYSYKLGYKTISTGNTTMEGFYLGLSVQY